MRRIITLIIVLLFISELSMAQDTMYMYKSGSVLNKQALANIDSIIFYKAGTSSLGNTVTDIDGNVYNTITIGTQVWMVENLRTTRYRDGTAIPNVKDNITWAALQTGAYCDYGNTPANSTAYGRLYNWYAAAGSYNICPTGWHLPTLDEWNTLIAYVGGPTGAGGKLKEEGQNHWGNPNVLATNVVGFTALPGGSRQAFFNYLTGRYDWENFDFKLLRYEGHWWTSTEVVDNIAAGEYIFGVSMEHNTGGISGYYTGSGGESKIYYGGYGLSVRCIKD